MADKSQNTEKPTPQRLRKAREEGQFPQGREFVSAMQFTVFVMWLSSSGREWLHQVGIALHLLLQQAFRPFLDTATLTQTLWSAAHRCFLPLGELGASLVAASLFFQLVTTNFGLSTKKLTPDFARLDPVRKIKGLGRQNIPAFVQAVVLLPVFGYAVYSIVRDRLDDFYNLPNQSLGASVHVVAEALLSLLWKAVFGFVTLGVINLFRQRFQYNRDMRMSRQDIKDENKQQEGNRQVKGQIRRLQRDMRRRTMMREVKNATAIITNPTHYAIAIRYQMSSMAAPTVLAKGKNYLAARIKQRALDHQIPIIENPPLARALYQSADVGQEIPAHLYKAVAEVLAYIYRIMKGRMPGQA